jgi:hypothetical protein
MSQINIPKIPSMIEDHGERRIRERPRSQVLSPAITKHPINPKDPDRLPTSEARKQRFY